MQVTYKAGRFYATNAPDANLMQALGWKWDKMKVAWVVADREKAAHFADAAVGDAKTRLDAFVQARHDAVKDSFALDASIDVPAPDGLQYRPYQRAGISYMQRLKNVLNADAMRLGKTVQTIGTVNTHPYPRPPGVRSIKFSELRVLVVCPANAKINWLREWKKWTIYDFSCGIVSGSNNPETAVLIINYDILSRHVDYINSVTWDYVVFDEAHRLKNERSARTQLCLGHRDRPGIPFKHSRIFLTGTPIKTRPVDLWPILKACDPQGLGKNWWHFVERYCDAKQIEGSWDFSGASNMEELQRRMRSAFMVRREKSDVAKEIPSNRQTIVLPKEGLVALVDAELDAVGTQLAEFEAALANSNGSLDPFAHFEQIARESEDLATARQALALAKLPMCIEHMEQLLKTEDKIVVFAYHRAVVKKLFERLDREYGAVMVIGGMTPDARQAAVDAFKDDPTKRVFVANIVSAGEAIDLSAANVACFVEITWSPSELDQAEERIWAVVKEEPLSIYKYVVEDSLDDRMLYVVESRQKNIDKAMNREHLAAY